MTDAQTTNHTPAGEIVTWALAQQEIRLDRIRQSLIDAGLPEDAIGDLRTETAFNRAVKELKEGRLIERVTRDTKTGIVVFQFTRTTLDEAQLRIDHDYEAKCTLDTTTGAISCPDSPEIEAHATRMFQHAVEHRQTSDVTRLIQRLFRTHADLFDITDMMLGVTRRGAKKGVAYFVPDSHRAFSAQMEDFLSSLGGALGRFTVHADSPSSARSLRDCMEAGLRSMADDLKSARDNWDTSTRRATMDKQMERLVTVAHKAEAYDTYLMDRAQAVRELLAEHKRELARKIDEISALKDNRKTAPDANGYTQKQFSATRMEEPEPEHAPPAHEETDYHTAAEYIPDTTADEPQTTFPF